MQGDHDMSIRIFILSQLMKENTYPYQLKKQLSEPIPYDEFTGLTESKLYYHFEALTKTGLIEPVEIIKEEHRPDKRVFMITSKGREELPKLIYKLFRDAVEVKDMVVGIACLDYVDRDQIIYILEEKLSNTREHWQELWSFEDKLEVDEERKILVHFLSEYFSSKIDHRTHWLEDLINRIKAKEI